MNASKKKRIAAMVNLLEIMINMPETEKTKMINSQAAYARKMLKKMGSIATFLPWPNDYIKFK